MKRIVFFTYDFPYPTNTGGKNRAYHLLKFAKDGVEISLFSFVRDDFKNEYTDVIKNLGVAEIRLFKRKKIKDLGNILGILSPTSSIFYSLYFDRDIENELASFIREKQIDIVHFESYWTAFYISNKIREAGAKQIFGTENIEYLIYRDYARYSKNPILKLFYYWESQKIKREGEEFMRNSDLCIAVTRQEAEFIKNLTGEGCFVVENGVDLDFFKFKPKKRLLTKNILFVGNFTYIPNVDAIQFFYSEVFSKIKDKNIKFTIVGKNSKKLRFIRDGRVEVIEFVPDIREIYDKADVMVSPVRIGGGTNFKILEAMAVGLPVIAHPARLGGLDVIGNVHLLTAQQAEEFSSQINRLMFDKELRDRLSRNARGLVEEKFDWRKIGKKLNKIWKEA